MPFDTRRRLACLALASLVIAAPARSATPADTLVVGDVEEPATLDPQAAATPAEFRVLSTMFEGLVRFKPGTMEVEPALAERWTVSPDGLTYRFDLKPGIAFQDGSPLDAEAVAFKLRLPYAPILASLATPTLGLVTAPGVEGLAIEPTGLLDLTHATKS